MRACACGLHALQKGGLSALLGLLGSRAYGSTSQLAVCFNSWSELALSDVLFFV